MSAGARSGVVVRLAQAHWWTRCSAPSGDSTGKRQRTRQARGVARFRLETTGGGGWRKGFGAMAFRGGGGAPMAEEGVDGVLQLDEGT
jgi:hypothetical protein